MSALCYRNIKGSGYSWTENTFLRYLKLITQIPVARFKILKLLHTISGNYQQKEIMTIKKSNRRIFLFTYFSPWFKQTARLNIESTWNIMYVSTFLEAWNPSFCWEMNPDLIIWKVLAFLYQVLHNFYNI